MPDNYYTKALRNSIVNMNCGLMTTTAAVMATTTKTRSTSQRKRRGCVVIIKRGSVFFFIPSSSSSSLLELVFALFSIHPVDYKYLCAQRRRKTTRVMSYVSRAGLLPSSPLLLVFVVCSQCF